MQISCIILFIFILHIIGVWVFSFGFFLTRVEVENQSLCEERILNDTSNHISLEGCWTAAPYKKVIVLIIDALRYDFVFKAKIDQSHQLKSW